MAQGQLFFEEEIGKSSGEIERRDVDEIRVLCDQCSRTSIDNPEWMSVNFENYRRSNYSIPSRYNYKEERFFDVLNNKKSIYGGRN